MHFRMFISAENQTVQFKSSMPAIQEIRVDLTELLQGPPAVTPQDSAVNAKLIVPCGNELGEGVIYGLLHGSNVK